MKSWYANSDLRGDPGIQLDVMKKLEQFAIGFEEEHGSQVLCSLVFDEMYIRRQVFWSLQQLQYIGHINYAQESTSQKKTIANQVMLFMLNGLNVDFEFPVAYFFIESLNTMQRKDLAKKREQGHPKFLGAEGIVEFIRKMNTLFDIFNTRHKQNQNIFKKAMNPDNKRIVFDYLKTCIDYFKGLKIEDESKKRKVSLISSRRKTAFRGFIADMHSVMLMYEKFVEIEGILGEFPTYYLLQDVIEMFFGKIRSCCGFNNNPNIHQFKGAYRKVQCNLNIRPSAIGNCRIFHNNLPKNFFYSDIYFVSSKRSTIEQIDCEELFEQQKKRYSKRSGFA